MLKFLHRTLVVINILFSLGLIISYLSAYINPEKFWILALMGLFYPFFLISNIIFLVYWIIRWKKAFFIPFFAILLGIGNLTNFIQLPFGKIRKEDSLAFKVLSYNVNLFKLYAWSTEKPSFTDIVKFTKISKADIVCFQEFFVNNGKLPENAALQDIGMNSHLGYSVRKNNSAYGVATFSKYPIVNKGEIRFENSFNSCIYSDIKIDDDTIRVFNCHLQSIRLKEKNINFLLDQSVNTKSSHFKEIKDIFIKLRDAFRMRSKQVKLILDHVKESPYPVIVCGDFNDSPMSYTYTKMTKNLSDSFKEAGKGIANTYSRFLPSYRIDYILHSKEFKTLRFSCPRVNYSDHYPVLGSFTIASR